MSLLSPVESHPESIMELLENPHRHIHSAVNKVSI
jgi:hypothetical protein